MVGKTLGGTCWGRGRERVGVSLPDRGQGSEARPHSVSAAAESIPKPFVGGGAECYMDPEKVGGGRVEWLYGEVPSAPS